MWDNKNKTMMSQAETPLTPEEEAVSESTSQQRLAELAEKSSDLARLVAGNAIAAPELLLRLSTSGDAIVRQNVAANPNTSTGVLLQLASEFPAEVWQNSVMSLLFLENPNFLNQLSKPALIKILMQDGVPVFFLEWAANESAWRLHLAVATNAKTPKAVLEKLCESSDAEVREAAELHVTLAGEMSSGWDEEVANRLATNKRRLLSKMFISGIAAIGLISEKAIALLPKDEYFYSNLQKSLGKPVNLSKPPGFDRNREGSEAVAANPNAPESVLALLAASNVSGVRREVAANPNTPVQILEQLISDSDSSVRRDAIAHYLQRNPAGLPKAIASYLKHHSNHSNRFLLLFHPQTPEELLPEYSRSIEWLERYAIASNPNTPLDTLRVLTGDGNRIVRAAARANWQNRTLPL